MFQRAEHDALHLISAVRPNIYDLVVTFTVGDNATPVMLLHVGDLFLCALDLLDLLLRDDHVINADGDARASRLGKAKLLKLVQQRDGLIMAAHLVATPDHVAEDALVGRFVDETNIRWPNLVEHDAAHGSLDDFLGGIAINRRASEIRILQPDHVVCLQPAFGRGEEHFVAVRKQHRPLRRLRTAEIRSNPA